jgi:hypothetical protein
VVGLNLGLPVCFKGFEDLFQLCGTEDGSGQVCAPGYFYARGYIYEDKACLAAVEDGSGRWSRGQEIGTVQSIAKPGFPMAGQSV